MSRINKWILGLTILTVVALASVALAGGVGGGRDLGTRGICAESVDGVLCESNADSDCFGNCETVDSGLCAQEGRGHIASSRMQRKATGNRPLDGSGARRDGGLGLRGGGCGGACT